MTSYIRAVVILLLKNLKTIPDTNGKKTGQKRKAAEQLAKGYDLDFTRDLFDAQKLETVLKREDIVMEPQEIKDYFTVSVLCDLVGHCPRDPLKDCIVRVARNFKQKLSDPAIKEKLDAEGMKLPLRSIQKMLPQKARFLIAYKCIQSVGSTVVRVFKSLTTELSDEALYRLFEEEGVPVKKRQRKPFTKSMKAESEKRPTARKTIRTIQIIVPLDIRSYLAINNKGEPDKRIREAARYCKAELSDEKINDCLRGAGIAIQDLPLESVLPIEKRLKWAVEYFTGPHKDPLELLKRSAQVCQKIIQEGSIQKALKAKGIDMEQTEIDRLMPVAELLALAFKDRKGCLNRALNQIKRKKSLKW